MFISELGYLDDPFTLGAHIEENGFFVDANHGGCEFFAWGELPQGFFFTLAEKFFKAVAVVFHLRSCTSWLNARQGKAPCVLLLSDYLRSLGRDKGELRFNVLPVFCSERVYHNVGEVDGGLGVEMIEQIYAPD